MAQNELAKKVSDLVNRSMSDVIKSMDKLAADQLINLSAAMQDKDPQAVEDILDQQPPADSTKLNARDTLKEINRVGKNILDQNQPLDKVWELVGNLDQDNWKLIWPAINRDIMIALYIEATDEETDSISASQAQEIYDYSQEFVTESYVIYRNQLCEVTIARGPSHTMGINYMGKTKMVSRSQVQKIDEHVLGMTQMPPLGRMMELAGVPTPASTTDTYPDINEEDAGIRQVLLQQISNHLQEIEKLENNQQFDTPTAEHLAEKLVRRAQRLLREYQNTRS